MEYQQYEFQCIDKPLSPEDRAEISSWSSRTEATASGATFTYSYSDFPKDEFQVVVRYFDIMLYQANWGTKRLLIKLPLKLVDYEALKQFDSSVGKRYYYERDLVVTRNQEYAFIDFNENDEDGYIDWVEEGSLLSLLPIREYIINGDYRPLYLFWLHAMLRRAQQTNATESLAKILNTKEPPVPNNLKKISAPLQDFIEYWAIESSWIKAACQNSQDQTKPTLDLEKSIKSLSEKEKNDYLLRLAKGELRLNQHFLKFLQKKEGLSTTNTKHENRRNVKDLVEVVKKIDFEKQSLAKAEAEKKKKEEMRRIANTEERRWESIHKNVSKGNSRAYDFAVETLKELLELAEFRNEIPAFKTQLEKIKTKFSRKSSFIRKVKNNFGHL